MATRVEVIADLKRVVTADFTRAVVKKDVGCPDCGGSGTKGTSEINITSCATCGGSGTVEEEVFEIQTMPDDLRPLVTGFKLGRQGRLMPEFRSKDTAVAHLIKVLGLDKPTLRAMRDAYGNDLKPDYEAEQVEMKAMLKDPEVAREALVHQLWAVLNNPTSSETAKIQANRQMGLLLGLQNEAGIIAPAASMDDFYAAVGEVTPDPEPQQEISDAQPEA